MASVKHKYNIKEIDFPIDGYKFNVQVLISVDGGENFYYCGIGKFCKTEEEAAEYIAQYKKENPDTEDEKENAEHRKKLIRCVRIAENSATSAKALPKRFIPVAYIALLGNEAEQ